MNKQSLLWIGPLLSFALGVFLSSIGMSSEIAWTAGVTLLCAIWWVSEALPIPATSLLPFVLLPIGGVLDHKQVSSALGSHVILLLMGAFMLSKGIEKSRLHERLALYMVRVCGNHSAFRLILGFMLASAFLSMWMSNTATTLMLLPIALAVLAHAGNVRFSVVLMLGIAYAASLGGVGTPIGTPPNIIFMSVYQETTGSEYSFTQWMELGVPIVVLGIPFMALWLSRGVKLDKAIELPEVSQWSKAEKRTLLVFGLTALGWLTRKEPFGGWSGLLGIPSAGDATVALAAVMAMFLISDGKKGRLLDWDTAKDIPWGMLLLFAGGIAIAKAFVASGLSQQLGAALVGLKSLPPFLLMLTVCLAVTFMTEMTSNTATATLLMPVLASASMAIGKDPAYLMIPAVISASCAFMLPVATAPNAIVYSTGKFSMQDMAREGVTLNFGLACIVSLMCWLQLG